MSELVDYFAHHYALVIDNTEGSYDEACRVAREAILEETPDVTRAEYVAMSTADRETAYAYNIGAGILALIEEWTDEVLDEHDGTMGAQLLNEVRITNGHDMAYALGTHYIPESGDVDFLSDEPETEEVPEDFPVRVLETGADLLAAADPVQCGTCDRWWDDAVSTSSTPAPSGRCPFEAFH